ncbi:uncharacterized protein LOC143230457 [Tachypleus tridentatus]|uniref:uncharacterized protein LOC143230457 n=1 Tax=Tachypleus tridentatus TaxID=6853 RepID=UPI003FD2EC14
MWVVTYLILLLWIGRPLRSEDVPPSYRHDRLFTDTIDSVVLDMTRQYFARENDLSLYDDLPEAEKTPKFFHGFTPDTGYNNREDLLIQNIYEKRFWTNSSPKLWRYIRFNNSDFLLSVGNKNAFMWQIHPVENWMKLETSTAMFTYTTNNAIIIDSITFGKTYEQLQMLAVVILEASEYASRLIVYQVVNGYSNQAMLLNLDDTPTKVDYVSTRFDSSIILLYHSSSGFNVKYIENGIGCWKNIIKIWLPNPVDLETFVINGLGYVAVANSSTCLIFKLDWFLQSHTEIETLHLDSIRDLHSFRVSFEHFFGIIASYEQYLLVWRNGKFHRKQLLKFPNAIHFHTAPLSSCRHDIVALLFQDTMPNSISLLSWHSRDQKLLLAPPQIIESFPKDIILLPGSIASFIYNKTTYLLSVDRRTGPRLFALNASLKPLPDPLLNRVRELENLIKHIQGRFEEYMINVEHLSLVLEHAVTDSSLIFKHQVFHTMNVLQKSIGALKMLESLSLEGSHFTLDDFKWTINSLNLKLNNVEQNLEDVIFGLQDVALLDQSTVMTGTNRIRAAEGSSLEALVLDVENIAATDLINLQGSTYRSDNPLLINGEVTFVLPVTVKESVDVGCCVNNFDLDQHIMATDKDQDSTAYYYMRRPMIIENSLHISGRVNNVDLSEELVTLHKKHKIKAHKIMKDSIHIYENLTVKLIDGIDVKEMKRFSLTENSTQIIFTKEFSQDIRVQDVTITGVFNNIKLNALGANILRIDKPTSILGKKTFEDNFSAIDRLSIKGTVDRLNLPNDLFNLNSFQNLTAIKTFHGYVSVTKTYISGLVDQIRTSDLVTLTLEDSLYDKVFARGIGVDEDVIIGRFVDNVDISNITLLIKSDSHLSGKTTFLAGVTVERNMDVQKKINELDVKRTYRDAIFKTNVVDIYSRKVFNALTVRSSTIDTINGLRMEDFMLTRGNQVLRGTKFLDETSFLDLQSGLSIIDQVDLALLETERISRSSSSTIQGPLNFFEILFVENATAGTVDGVILQNAVVVSLPQEVETKIFKPNLVGNRNKKPSLLTREMRIRSDVEVATTLDAVDLTELARRRITISSNQNILVELIFSDNDAVLIEADRVNDFNFTKLSGSVMSLSKPQTVFEKSFESQISIFGDIGTSEGVSTIRLNWVNSNAIHLNEDHILSGYFIFVNVLSVAEDLVLQERVSSINIAQLVEDSVMIEGHHILTQPVRFESLLQIDGDINAALVNGVYLPEKLLTLTAPQILTGVFIFEHGLGLSSDLLTSGLINGIDVSYLSAMTMKLDLNNKLLGNLVFVEVEIKELSVSNLVNGINFSLLQTEAILVNEKDHITILKSISNDVFVERNFTTNVVNNVYMEHFVADLIWITGDQNIPTSKTFNEEVVILNNLKVLGPPIVSTIDGTDIARLAKEAVFVDKPQKIEDVKIFINFVDIDGTITIYGPINNIDLSVGAITVNRTEGDIQLIYGEKSFTMVLFKDHITVTQRVNSLLLKEHLGNTLITTGNQIMSGYKMIKGNLLCEKDLHLSRVNNISIRETVNLHSENVISGELKFSGGVKSRNLYVQGLINKIDVRVLIEEAVYLDTTQEVLKEFFLSEVLVQKDLLVGREVDHIDLDKLDKSVVSFDISFTAETQDILKETSIQRYIGDYLWDILEDSLYQLDKFVFYASLNVTGDFLDILPEATDFNIVKMPRNSYYGSTYTFVLEHSKLLYLDSIATTTTIRRVPVLILQRVFIIYVAAAHSAVDTTIMEMEQPVASLGQGILDVSVINRDEYHCNIIVLDVEGTCTIYVFGNHGYKSLLTEVTSVHIGKEATAIAGFLLHKKEVHVAVARKFPSLYTQGSSLLLKLRNGNLELVQEIAAPASNDVVYFEYGAKHYLVFTNVAPVHEALETNSVQVYRTFNYLETSFRLYQKISFNNPTSLEVFELGSLQELYMIISNSTGVEFYHLQGERGFVSTTMLVREDVRDVKPFVAKDELYVAIAQGELALSSTILKAKMKGSTVPPRFKIHWS